MTLCCCNLRKPILPSSNLTLAKVVTRIMASAWLPASECCKPRATYSLGWTSDGSGRDYYFRQLCDMKMKLDLSKMSKADWFEYVEIGLNMSKSVAGRSRVLRPGPAIQRALPATWEQAISSMPPLPNLRLVTLIRPNKTTPPCTRRFVPAE